MDKKSILGQYFTPRHITRMMSQMLNPKIKETIYDPFCGTGGMLVACYDMLRNQIKTSAQKHHLNKKTLFGGDISAQASQLAKMNMILLGDGHSNIHSGSDNIHNSSKGKYDHIITNIPFNMHLEESAIEKVYDDFGGLLDGNAAATLHCLHSVKKGGNAAIIVPETIAYDSRYQDLRHYIRNNFCIRAVIRLPKKLFTQYTTARTCLLLLSNAWADETMEFPSISLTEDGFSHSQNREPIPENQIPQLLEAMDNWDGLDNCEILAANDGFHFISGENNSDDDYENSWALGDLLIINKKEKIKPNARYAEPRLNSKNNTVSVSGQERYGRNLGDWEKGRVIAHAGDLIIGTLHTQSGKGLFAIADRDYVSASQIVARIDEDIVEKDYLLLALNSVLPTLSKEDLTGRETYTEREILALRIPFPPRDWKKRKDRILVLKKQIEKLNNELTHETKELHKERKRKK